MEIFAIRHGETAWSLSGQHTGRTDIPLTDEGRRQAERLRPALAGRTFALVLVSPLMRARDTCVLAGLGDQTVIEPDLLEWHYGDYEGITTATIRARMPEWHLFRDGAPQGESPAEIGARADRVIDRALGASGDVAVFAHGHILRVLAARWIGLPTSGGQHFLLGTATISVLGHNREYRAIKAWNESPTS